MNEVAGEVINAVQLVTNIGASVAMPFVVWMLADLRRDVREMKTVNLESIYKRLGDLENRLVALETDLQNLKGRYR